MYGILDDEDKLVAAFAAGTAVSSNIPVNPKDALSLRRSMGTVPAQRWEIRTRVVPMSGGGNELLSSTVEKGLSGSIRVRVPQNYGVIRRREGSKAPISLPPMAGLKGGTFVSMPAYSGLIPAGTFVRFNNHVKVYVVNWDFDGSGDLSIFPPLRVDLDEASMLHRDDVVMLCKYGQETLQGMRYSDGILMDPELVVLIEDLEKEDFIPLPQVLTSTVYTVAVDTNGVIMELPLVGATLWSIQTDAIQTYGMAMQSGNLVDAIRYPNHTVYDVDATKTDGIAMQLGVLTPTVRYINHTVYDVDATQTYGLAMQAGVLTVTTRYTNHNVYDVDATKTDGVAMQGGTLT